MTGHLLFRSGAFLLLSAFCAAGGAVALFDPADPIARERVKTNDVQTETLSDGGGTALLVNSGLKGQWPGIELHPPGGLWDLGASGYVEVAWRNRSDVPLTLHCRVDNHGADGVEHCLNGSQQLGPGKDGAFRVPLQRWGNDNLGGKLFGMNGYPKTPGGQGTIDPARIPRILLFVTQSGHPRSLEVRSVRAGGEPGAFAKPTALTADASPFFPFIDGFGQYRHKSWPGKINSLAELTERRVREEAELAATKDPAGWNRYGGWAGGPQQKATGFFRVEKTNGKWWLIDPDGALFFSQGIDCVGALDATPIEERGEWFEDFPGNDPRFAGFQWKAFALKNHYAGRKPLNFSFAGANFLRKYGDDWAGPRNEMIHRRLRAWGVNTIGNWSDGRLCMLRRTPYTDLIGTGGARMIEGSEGYWGKFPDVFDPSFKDSVRASMLSKEGKSAGDPWCIGYFCDNEMSWGDSESLALGALASPFEQPAKRVFIAVLRDKYRNLARLNRAWGTGYESWETVGDDNKLPDKQRAGEDLRGFSRHVAETYFREVRAAVKSVAPAQLYLGCRFAWANPLAAAAAAEYCDVVSYNIYQDGVRDFEYPLGRDVPVIIGEFHFGALDRGMMHTGLMAVENQRARAKAYENYVLDALEHPQMVGCHWFQYQDQPTTGRGLDGENYQIGFVDVADTPYPEMTAASRRLAERMYPTRAGK